MTTAIEGKEEQIARLLAEGITPVDVMKRGFRRGTVYKINRRLRTGGTPQESGGNGVDLSIENDPDVVDLKKTLRKAELERQIAEIKGPSFTESRLSDLEQEMEELECTLDGAMDAFRTIKASLDNSPLIGLRGRFACACGSRGFVGTKVVCTACDRETTYGWWPEGSG